MDQIQRMVFGRQSRVSRFRRRLADGMGSTKAGRGLKLFAATCISLSLLLVHTSSLASAQEIPDVPSLDFSTEVSSGEVGETVEGSVDPEDISQKCLIEPENFVLQFVSDLEVPLGTTDPTNYRTRLDEWLASQDDYGDDPADVFAYGAAYFFPAGLAQDLESNGGDG